MEESLDKYEARKHVRLCLWVTSEHAGDSVKRLRWQHFGSSVISELLLFLLHGGARVLDRFADSLVAEPVRSLVLTTAVMSDLAIVAE